MKIVKIGSVYPTYSEKFYASRPGLAEKSYQEQQAALDYDGFGWADFWAVALRKLGYEATELRGNVAPLQMAWARENGCTFTDSGWMLETLRAQILSLRPEVLFVDDYDLFPYEWIKEVREICKTIRFVIGWCGAPFEDPNPFKAYDIVLSNIPRLVEDFKKMKHRSFHFNHAFDPRILERIDLNREPANDFSFIGQIVRSHHQERERMLEELVRSIDIRIYSPSAELTLKDDLKALAKKGAYIGIQALRKTRIPDSLFEHIPKIRKAARWTQMPMQPVSAKLRPFMKPAVYGLQMFQALHDSKATFNSHIDLASKAASNMRLFEAAGVGTCLVTDWKENLETLFKPESEVVTYRTAPECVEKVRWLLDHPNERKAIAKAGQARILRDHTYDRRAEQLAELLKSEL